MTRNLFVLFLITLFATSACRKDDEGVQRIDQILHLYIDSAGIDMLNSKIPGAYTQVKLNDVYGTTDNAPVSFQDKKDADTIHYIYYVAGARRIVTDSADSSHKTVQSKIALNLVKQLTDTTFATTRDTLLLNYRFTPEVFELSEAFYNGTQVFTKTAGQPNVIKIHK